MPDVARDGRERQYAKAQSPRHRASVAHAFRFHGDGELAATLAHELNQPLAAILNYARGAARRMKAGTATDAALQHALEQIAGQANRAAETIRSLREFVRKREPERRRVCLNRLVRTVVRRAGAEARECGAAVRLKLAEGLPSVMVDRNQIERVILNLFRNGLEAMEQTLPDRRELFVGTAPGDDQTVEVVVRDRGRGLEAVALERVFEPFYTTKPQGMGIGLSICRSIVEAHGGSLWGESKGSAGAAFRFTLPLARE